MTVFLPGTDTPTYNKPIFHDIIFAPAFQVWSSGSQDTRHRNTSKKPTLCYDLDLHMTQTYNIFGGTLNLIQSWVAEDSRLNPFAIQCDLDFQAAQSLQITVC